jgi:hypothetical protein
MAKSLIVFLVTGISEAVEQLITYPKFEGLNPGTDGTK